MPLSSALIIWTVLLAAAGPAFSQATVASPTWTSDQVRAARSLAAEPALAFDVRRETTSKNSAPEIEASHVVIAPDFTYITTGKSHVLDDFDLRRTFSWTDGAGDFTSLNGHALPAFRTMELANRRMMKAMTDRLAAASGKPIGPSDDEPYWREAELAVSDPSDNPLSVRKTPAGTAFLLGDEPVVQAQGKAAALLDADRKPFIRYVAGHLPLHPQARRALTDAGTLPETIEIELYQGFKKETLDFAFSRSTRSNAPYPLPPGLRADVESLLAPKDPVTTRGIRAAVQAIDGRFAGTKPTFGEMTAALRKAGEAGRSMEVWLRFLEIGQQYGYRLTSFDGAQQIQSLRPLIMASLNDPNVVRFHHASDLAGGAAGDAVDKQNAARYLASASALDALPFGTFRYVTFANLVIGSRDIHDWDANILKSMPSPLAANYWAHIAAYPWASNAYKDAGLAYMRAFDTPKAWTAFDLGRAVDPDWKSSAMGEIANYEAVLEANAPDFF